VGGGESLVHGVPQRPHKGSQAKAVLRDHQQHGLHAGDEGRLGCLRLLLHWLAHKPQTLYRGCVGEGLWAEGVEARIVVDLGGCQAPNHLLLARVQHDQLGHVRSHVGDELDGLGGDLQGGEEAPHLPDVVATQSSEVEDGACQVILGLSGEEALQLGVGEGGFGGAGLWDRFGDGGLGLGWGLADCPSVRGWTPWLDGGGLGLNGGHGTPSVDLAGGDPPGKGHEPFYGLGRGAADHGPELLVKAALDVPHQGGDAVCLVGGGIEAAGGGLWAADSQVLGLLEDGSSEGPLLGPV
jgi:hypothetical protein